MAASKVASDTGQASRGTDGMSNGQPKDLEGLNVRTYEAHDEAAVRHLFEAGLLAGQVAANDTGADIDHIQAAYFDQPRHHFWVAEAEGRVLGMIGVASDEQHTAEVRRLRVDPAYQDTNIAARLLAIAIDHCKHHNYLKVRLDTRFDTDAAVDLFDRVGFQHTRTKALEEKELLEFYFDIYRPESEQ